jgi:hypothetical protein
MDRPNAAARKRRLSKSGSSKTSFKALFVRTALVLLFIIGMVYLANQAMFFGLDKFVR